MFVTPGDVACQTTRGHRFRSTGGTSPWVSIGAHRSAGVTASPAGRRLGGAFGIVRYHRRRAAAGVSGGPRRPDHPFLGRKMQAVLHPFRLNRINSAGAGGALKVRPHNRVNTWVLHASADARRASDAPPTASLSRGKLWISGFCGNYG
jgi:hypothetical protein